MERYERIESGDECRDWLPVISAMVDGEATPEQVIELRPHLRNCPGCRATLKSLQDSSTPLAALMPIPLVVVGTGAGDQVSSLLMRIYEGIAGGFPERAVHSVTKAQGLLEASAAGKLTAVAASAAAVAGGGYASVERVIDRPSAARRVAQTQAHHRSPVRRASLRAAPTVVAKPPAAVVSTAAGGAEVGSPAAEATPTPPTPAQAPEFLATTSTGSTTTSTSRSRTAAAYVTRTANYRSTATKSRSGAAQGFAPKGRETVFAP